LYFGGKFKQLKKRFFGIITFLLPLFVCAQEEIESHFLKLNILTPGITYEKGIGQNLSLNIDAVLGFLFHVNIESGSGSNNSVQEDYFILYPGMATTMQYYFNRGKRENRGRSLYKNSGMFFGPQLLIQGPDIVNTNPSYVDLCAAISVGGVWGIQRTFKSNVNIAFNLGMGYASVFGEGDALGGFTFLNKLLIGYVFLPRKEKRKQYEMPEDYKY